MRGALPGVGEGRGSKDSAGGLAIGAEINCCFDSDTEIGLMKQKIDIKSQLTKLTSQRDGRQGASISSQINLILSSNNIIKQMKCDHISRLPMPNDCLCRESNFKI